jgi:ribosomal protein S18 acetylase RimI-like enzyme
MEHSEEYTIRELTPELLDDYLAFFDKDAFADNPAWGFCYCRCHHFPHKERDWGRTTAQENREAVINLILSGTLRGHLAYSGEKPVGWCNAGPREGMTTVPDYDEPDADRIGSIVCFVIAKEHRRRGIARRLLEAACEGFKAQGFVIAEAYVLKGAGGDAMNYPGPLSMYLSAGFEQYRECCCDGDDTIVVRKRLA